MISRDKLILGLATGFGSGYLPRMPGTWGTLIAIIPYIALRHLPLASYLLVCGLSFIAGIALCQRACQITGIKDDSRIVWDEIVGFWLTMTAAPAGLIWIAIGFGLFRLFDITKPWPIKILERHPHTGLAVMADDMMAAVYAGLCLQLFAFLWSLV